MTHSAWWLGCNALAVYRLSAQIVGTAIVRRRWPWSVWWMSLPVAAVVAALTVEIPSVWQYPMFVLALSASAGLIAEN